jgi:hypothetical protein
LRLKTRVLAAAGALTMVGSLGLFAAPAHALVVPVGACSGSLSVGTVTPGLTDTTQAIVLSTKLLKNLTTKVAIGGTCAGFVKFPIAAPPSGTEAVTKEAAKLSGAASCSQTATGPGVDPGDPAAALGYPPNGKISLATATNSLSAYIHINGLTGDVAGIGGAVTKGSSVGATVGGSLWENPAVKLLKTDPTYPGVGSSGYDVDPTALVSLLGCADGVPGTVTAPGLTLAIVGDSGFSPSPLLGSPATGLTFTFGI